MIITIAEKLYNIRKPRWQRINFVYQRGFYDCGVAVFAMFNGLTYKQAKKYMRQEYGVSLDEMRSLRKGKKKRIFKRYLKDIVGGTKALLIKAKPSEKFSSHWILLDDDIVYDPELGVFKIDDYPEKDRKPLYAVET